MKDELEFAVSLPTKDGFFGRECANTECKRYFRIEASSLSEKMYCPYCGELFTRDELLTQSQASYVFEQAKPEISRYAVTELQKLLIEGFSGSKDVSFKPSRIPPARKPTLAYTEPAVDSELTCPACQVRFQVYGIFGFCPHCRLASVLIYDANIHVIEQEVALAEDKTRALRHAYSDLVSTFEGFCRKRVGKDVNQNVRFQNLRETRKFFRETADRDIFAGLSEAEVEVLKRIFLTRHVYEHNNGIIGDRYVREIPKDKHLLGSKAPLSLEEFKHGAAILRHVLDIVVTATTK